MDWPPLVRLVEGINTGPVRDLLAMSGLGGKLPFLRAGAEEWAITLPIFRLPWGAVKTGVKQLSLFSTPSGAWGSSTALR